MMELPVLLMLAILLLVSAPIRIYLISVQEANVPLVFVIVHVEVATQHPYQAPVSTTMPVQAISALMEHVAFLQIYPFVTMV